MRVATQKASKRLWSLHLTLADLEKFYADLIADVGRPPDDAHITIDGKNSDFKFDTFDAVRHAVDQLPSVVKSFYMALYWKAAGSKFESELTVTLTMGLFSRLIVSGASQSRVLGIAQSFGKDLAVKTRIGVFQRVASVFAVVAATEFGKFTFARFFQNDYRGAMIFGILVLLAGFSYVRLNIMADASLRFPNRNRSIIPWWKISDSVALWVAAITGLSVLYLTFLAETKK